MIRHNPCTVPVAGRVQLLDKLPSYLSTALCHALSSGHHLAIETGRWTKIPREDRKCLHCDDIEDERHAFFVCPCYADCRDSLHGFMLLKYSIFSPTAEETEAFVINSLQNRRVWTVTETDQLFVAAKFLYSVLKLAFSVYSGRDIIFV